MDSSGPAVGLAAVFPERFAIEVHSTEGARTVVACLELVSPGNKDRASKRRLFAAKCATHLARGVGLIVVDVVTSRHGNLHNELTDLLDQDGSFRLPDTLSLYAVAYRPLQGPNGAHIETWPLPLAVGQHLPRAPLSLSADCCIAVDLETAYVDACRRRRVEEVLRRPGGAVVSWELGSGSLVMSDVDLSSEAESFDAEEMYSFLADLAPEDWEDARTYDDTRR